MKIDMAFDETPLEAEAAATYAETAGFAGFWVRENRHDPFLLAAMASRQTTTMDLGIGVAIALARSPMTVATSANDLHQLSAGRLKLGLGSQVRSHIVNRFSMEWSQPAARMEEYIRALRAIWRSWREDRPLNFDGQFYHHTLMPPNFRPSRHGYGTPKVYLGGVGKGMASAAARVADGFICHPFATVDFLKDVLLPRLFDERGAAADCETRLEICGSPFIVTGRDEKEMASAMAATRRKIAFYASTPSYRPVLEAHGWEGLQQEMAHLARNGSWDDMGEALEPEILHAIAIVAEPQNVVPMLRTRYASLFDRATLYTASPLSREVSDLIMHGKIASDTGGVQDV